MPPFQSPLPVPPAPALGPVIWGAGAERSHGEKRQNRFLERVTSASSTLRPPGPALPSLPDPLFSGASPRPPGVGLGEVPLEDAPATASRRRRRSWRLRPLCPSHPLPPEMEVSARAGASVSSCGNSEASAQGDSFPRGAQFLWALSAHPAQCSSSPLHPPHRVHPSRRSRPAPGAGGLGALASVLGSHVEELL